MENSEKYYEAKQRVKKKKGFYSHLSSYLIVNLVFLLITYMNGQGPNWLYICLFWGIGLASHYLAVFGLPGKQKIGSKEWEEKEIQKELEKIGGHSSSADAKNEEGLELKELEKRPRDWEDQDFV